MENVERGKEELVGGTECKQNGTHVVESHERIGREVGHFVRRLSLYEGGVHLDPVAGDVQRYHYLEEE